MIINLEIVKKDRGGILYPFKQLRDFAARKVGERRLSKLVKPYEASYAQAKDLIDGLAGMYCLNVDLWAY
ncbi:hypothetical protein ACVIHI_000140 [Bradyrhizobium sp. USDA 4524]|uniref:hypothetical protein n=1 Tax=unclassified Bradyrhizobium TaxID=2631580 RepID=UPI00209DE580|nr:MULTISPECIES: hypothetical protein [unclassified Bradyrhizobium]MCP1838495.1 hypothetical protein [Bradyrhizobium sp. USDA 4538]MCP1899059.1 hypothetical protein [Bradyrhizobium sp. USDA 4537]MCP1986828.1 hypothetical protein [Bradyrhizobium sp. USDA 4539]